MAVAGPNELAVKVVLAGASGCGKSDLMRALAVRIGGVPVREGVIGGTRVRRVVALWPGRFAVLGGQGWAAGLSLALALLAVIGDLAESLVKRCLGAKDSGALLPGIGGAFDLIDSLCFTAPVLWCYLQWRLA